MFTNFLKTTFRNIIRRKGYSIINIIGLTAGITCCVLIFLYVRFELSYDKYHKNTRRIYRVAKQSEREGKIDKSAKTPAPMAVALINDLPGVEDAVRLDKPGYKMFVKSGDNWIHEKNFLFADPSIFKIFSFPFISGKQDTALTDPASIVITERAAKKYFGDENPIGEMITFKRSYSWFMGLMGIQDRICVHKVTGVLKNIPGNSHFKFDFIAPFTTYNSRYLNQWGAWNFVTYILTRDDGPPGELEKKLPAFLKKYRGNKAKNTKLYLQPLSRIHLHSDIRHEIEPGGRIGNLYLFSSIAVIILLIACINFMNLSTALSFSRSREVGVRKVLGAGRIELIAQFLFESTSLAFIALPLAILAVRFIMPAFNTFVGREITVTFRELLPLIPGLFLLTVFVGIVSGSYPAFFVSTFQPGKILEGKVRAGQRKFFVKTLVVLQFALSVTFIICSFIGYRQLNFIRNKDLNFDKDGIIQVPIHSQKILDSISAIKDELVKDKNTISVAASSFLLSGNLERTGAWWEELPQDQVESMAGISIDSHFIETLGLELKAGRNLNGEQDTGIILNESAVKRIGWDSPGEAIGKRFKYGIYAAGQVIGVVHDFHFRSLHENIQPLVLFNGNKFKYFNNLLIKINRRNPGAAIDAIRRTWNSFEPYRLFEYYFFDETFDGLHKKDKLTLRMFQYASFLSILIACIGLFGLTTLTTEQRTKEIGIRKTFGASVSNIVYMLLKEYAGFVLLANTAAWPAAYLLMNEWLRNFAYRIGIGWWVFAMTGVLSLVIVLVTISYRSIKAALSNPVETLRYE